jgi:hypothetical protein
LIALAHSAGERSGCGRCVPAPRKFFRARIDALRVARACDARVSARSGLGAWHIHCTSGIHVRDREAIAMRPALLRERTSTP